MNNKPNKGSTDGLQVSAYVTPQMRETLRELSNGNISQGIRVAVSEPRQSPSGADWITSPAQLPDPASCIGPNVLTTPVGVMAHGIAPTSPVLDMETSELSFLTPDSGVTSELTLANLALIAGRLGVAVIACCDPGADERGQTVGGIKVSRLGHGLIELSPASTTAGKTGIPAGKPMVQAPAACSTATPEQAED